MKIITTFLATLATLTAATPVKTPRGNPGSIYVCTGTNWTGNCKYFANSLISTTSFGCTPITKDYHHAKSIGADEGPGCAVFSEPECKGMELDVTFPGISNTGETFQWEGTAKSFQCRFVFDPPQ